MILFCLPLKFEPHAVIQLWWNELIHKMKHNLSHISHMLLPKEEIVMLRVMNQQYEKAYMTAMTFIKYSGFFKSANDRPLLKKPTFTPTNDAKYRSVALLPSLYMTLEDTLFG